MKRLFARLLAIAVVFIVPAAVWASDLIDDGSLMGAGAMMTESPYKGADDDIYPVPVLIFESKRFFVDKTVAGYYFNDKSEAFRWAVIGSLRMQGYEADDSSDLEGMQDRDLAFDGGLRVSWKNEIINMILEGVTDLSDTHQGQELRLTIDKELFDGFLTPKAGIKWLSNDLADYYYGVRPNEVSAGRHEYSAESDLEYMAGVTIGLPLGKKWAMFADIQCSFLGKEGKDSPIVGDDALMRYVMGVVYRF
ncbi:MAG: MipA/OmpV family protein [Candidatus Omnitrophota bacterium]